MTTERSGHTLPPSEMLAFRSPADLMAALRAIRQHDGRSLQSVGMAIGMDKPSLQQYEQGKKHAKFDQLARIARGLGFGLYLCLGPLPAAVDPSHDPP